MNTEVVIDINELTKIYHTEEVETHALSGINLKIRKGEYVAIMGPSGCGKTTLMSILGLLDVPTSGFYQLAGNNVSQIDSVQRAIIRNNSIGFIFQSFNLIGDLNVYENVELPLVYRGGISRNERRRRVAASLESVGMSHRMQHYPAQLSGGQQQRAAAARALVGNPAILLADEPTGNLDSSNGEMVMSLLAELNAKGTTVLTVTHDARYAAYAKRIVRLFDGQIVSENDMAN
jgi:putative ABC transport system ATP-binding protein